MDVTVYSKPVTCYSSKVPLCVGLIFRKLKNVIWNKPIIGIIIIVCLCTLLCIL